METDSPEPNVPNEKAAASKTATGDSAAGVSGVGAANALPTHSGGESSLSAPRLIAAMAIACLIGWGGVVASPQWAEVPEDMLTIDMYSPAAEQERLAAKEREIYWKNSLAHFLVLGFGFGTVPLVLSLGGRRVGVAAVAGIASGLVSGAAAFFVGWKLREYIDSGAELPLLGNAQEGMSGDILVFIVAGILVSIPVLVGVLLSTAPGAGGKAIAVPLAAVLAGLLFPIVASIVLPNLNTKQFPIMFPSLLAIWLGLLAVLLVLLIITTGDRKRGAAQPEPSEA